MVKMPGTNRWIVIGCKYLKRTWRKEILAPDVLTVSAGSLEPIGAVAAVKSIMKPENGLKLKGVISDGDSKDSGLPFSNTKNLNLLITKTE